MKKYERNFLNAINDNADSFDFAYEGDNADASPPMASAPRTTAAIKGNPVFSATVNLNFITKYFEFDGTDYSSITPTNLAGGLQSDLPFFVFGNNDFASGFRKLKGEFPINPNWSYGVPFVYGKDSDMGGMALDAVVLGSLIAGDLVIPFTSALPGGGSTTLAINIVRCPEVAYGTLLSMLNSDRFIVNGIRYALADKTKLEQFTRQIQFNELSIFGKFKSDKLTPNDYKVPEQFQEGLIDIPIGGIWGGIDKHKSWGFFNVYDNVESSWTVFAQTVKKLSA